MVTDGVRVTLDETDNSLSSQINTSRPTLSTSERISDSTFGPGLIHNRNRGNHSQREHAHGDFASSREIRKEPESDHYSDRHNDRHHSPKRANDRGRQNDRQNGRQRVDWGLGFGAGGGNSAGYGNRQKMNGDTLGGWGSGTSAMAFHAQEAFTGERLIRKVVEEEEDGEGKDDSSANDGRLIHDGKKMPSEILEQMLSTAEVKEASQTLSTNIMKSVESGAALSFGISHGSGAKKKEEVRKKEQLRT
jgi:hypothetical protein